MMSKHPATFGVHRSCEIGDIPFFNCHLTTCLMCHHPAKSGLHMPCESEDITFLFVT